MNRLSKSTVETGKRALLVALAAVALTLPLHGQETAGGDLETAPTLSSSGDSDPQQNASPPNAQSPPANSDHALTGSFFHRLAQFYGQDWAGTNPAAPSLTKRGLPAPVDAARLIAKAGSAATPAAVADSTAQTSRPDPGWETRPPARAAYAQADEQYRSTVLTAFQNVADTLHALQQDADALKAAAAAKDAASVTLDLTKKQLDAGYTNYLALLSAEQAYQQALINLVQAQSNRYADTAALFQALGGGWWNRTDIAKN
jgi:hypothetical protein